jgi:uncharacterized delta-60 repeat protein
MTPRPLFAALAAACAAAALAPVAAVAAPGQLDPGFGDRGRVHVDNILDGLGEDGTNLGQLQVLPDGRIVVVGSQRYCMGCFSQVVARYAADGTPDPSFGKAGVRSLLGSDDYGDGSSGIGLLVRSDGGLVLGYDRGPGPRMAQVAPDGDAPPAETATEKPFVPRAQLPDGRVVALDGGGTRMVLLRPDMTPDPSFGGEAGASMPFVARKVLGVAATADAVLVAGTDGRDLILVRYRLDGTRVATLRARVPRPPRTARWEPSFANPEALQVANGRAVIVTTWERTYRRKTDWRTAVAAFSLRENRVVAGFGKGGIAFAAQRFMRGALQRDGRVLLVSSGADQLPWRPGKLVVRRLDATGRPDWVRTVATGFRQLMGMDVALDPAGRLLVAGAAFKDYPSKGVLFMRFLTR